MLQNLTMEQMKEIRRRKMAKEQEDLADQGRSSAVVNGLIVTIGDADCDYLDFKHFIVAQIARMGFSAYIAKTDWNTNELIYDLAEEESDSEIWTRDVINYFDGMEGNY